MANFTPVGVIAQVKDMGKFQSGMGKITGLIAGVASAATSAAIGGITQLAGGIVNLGKQTISAGIDFESAFAGVIKTTDGLVDETGKLTTSGSELRQEFRDLSKDIPIAVEELLKIGELGGQLGIGRDQLIEFTDTIAAMGVSTNLTTEEAATEMARMANVMGTVGKEGDDAFSKIGSAIVALGNNFATTERDVMNFASRISGAAAVAGVSESDVLAIGAAMSSVGVQAEAGGTAVQKVLLGMNEAVVQGNDQLEIFAATAGLTTEGFARMWEQDAGGAFSLFVEGLGTAGDDALMILDALDLKDQRLTRAFLSLAGAGNLLTDAMYTSYDAFNQNVALQDEAGKRYATTESQIQIFKNTIKDLGITIGSALLPFLNQALEFIKPFVQELGERLPGFIEGTVVPALNKLFELWGTYFPIIRDAVVEFWGNVEPILILVANWFQTEGPAALEQLQAVWGEVWPFIQELAQKFVTWFQENLPLIIDTGQAIVDFWNNSIVPTLDNIWEIIKTIVSTAVDSILSSIRIFMLILTGDWEGAWNEIKLLFSRIVLAILEVWDEFLEGVLNAFGSTYEEFKAQWLANWELLKTIATGIFDNLKSAIQQKWQEIKDALTGGITSAIQTAKRILGIGSPSKVFMGIGQDMAQGLIDGLTGMSPQVQMAVGGQMATVAAAPVVSRSTSIQIGPNSVYDGMSRAVFEDRVLQIVRSNL